MKKHFKLLAIPLILLIPVTAFGITLENPLRGINNFQDLLFRLIDVLWTISIPIVGIAITIAGFYFITAQGEPEKIKTAKNILLWALIGFLIIISAKGAVGFISGIF